MGNLLLIVLIVGSAVAFSTELLEAIADRFMDSRWVKIVLTVPLAGLFCWLLGVRGFDLIVPALAAAFIALFALKLLARSEKVQQVVTRRSY